MQPFHVLRGYLRNSKNFRSLSSGSSNQCINNQNGNNQCTSDICFSHFHATSEGDIERFDCSQKPSKLSTLSCAVLLNKTDESSVCLGDGKFEINYIIFNIPFPARDTHCCCTSSSSPKICAPEKRKMAELTQLWTMSQVWWLVFGHVGLSCVVLLLVTFYMKSVKYLPKYNIVIPEESRMTTILWAKVGI